MSLWEPALPRAWLPKRMICSGVEFLGDQLGNGLNCRPVDRDFSHLRETSLRRFCHGLD